MRGQNSDNTSYVSGGGKFGSGRGYFGKNPRPVCQICNKTGHIAIDCFQHLNMSFLGRHPPEKLAAMVSNTNG